jgi:hypothetical protein
VSSLAGRADDYRLQHQSSCLCRSPETVDPKIEDETDSQLLERVHRAADTLKLVFAAWARYEMEEVHQKDRFFETRQEWGKMARFFLTDPDD